MTYAKTAKDCLKNSISALGLNYADIFSCTTAEQRGKIIDYVTVPSLMEHHDYDDELPHRKDEGFLQYIARLILLERQHTPDFVPEGLVFGNTLSTLFAN